MPLVFVKDGETATIKKITGNDNMRRHLSDLGFVPGELVTIVNRMNGGLIVNVKGARVALDGEMGARIIV